MAESKHIQVYRKMYLDPDETILATAPGWIGKMMGSGGDTQHNGALIATNRQVVFYRKGIMSEVLETIPISNISSIQRKSFAGHHRITFYTSNNTLEFKSFDKKAISAIANSIQQMRSGRGPEVRSRATPPPPPPTNQTREFEEYRRGRTKATTTSNDQWLWIGGAMLVAFASTLFFSGWSNTHRSRERMEGSEEELERIDNEKLEQERTAKLFTRESFEKDRITIAAGGLRSEKELEDRGFEKRSSQMLFDGSSYATWTKKSEDGKYTITLVLTRDGSVLGGWKISSKTFSGF